MDSFKKFAEEKLSERECFYSCIKDKTTGDNGKKIDSHINDEDYLMCKKFGMKLTWKLLGIITIII